MPAISPSSPPADHIDSDVPGYGTRSGTTRRNVSSPILRISFLIFQLVELLANVAEHVRAGSWVFGSMNVLISVLAPDG